MTVISELVQRVRHFPFPLQTPSGKRFNIVRIDEDRVFVQAGRSGSTVKISADALEKSAAFLSGKGWVKIGAANSPSDGLTFYNFAKNFPYGTCMASYAAPLLELVGIVEISHKYPAEIRLKQSSPEKSQ
jgi:hypothetical protein